MFVHRHGIQVTRIHSPQVQGQRALVARVARSVEGMDVELFRSALEIKRVFDSEIAQRRDGQDPMQQDHAP